MINYFKLIRWSNLLFLGVLLWVMEKWVAVPLLNAIQFEEVLPWWILLLIILASVCIAAGGYVINDYFDVKIDRINRPDKLIITHSVSKDQAMLLYRIITIVGVCIGLWVAWVLRSMPLAIIYLMTPGLLWFYSSSYKRQFVLGNLIVSFVTALAPLSIALANVGMLQRRFGSIMSYLPIEHNLLVWIGMFSLFAFLTTWIREIVKDLQDQHGDRELECHTLPIVCGTKWTKVIVTTLLLLTTTLIGWIGYWILPFPHDWMSVSCRYIIFGLFIPIACEIWLLWAAKVPSEYYHAQLLMKFIMFLGVMYAFVIINQASYLNSL